MCIITYGTLYSETTFIIFSSISPAEISFIISAPFSIDFLAISLLNVSTEIIKSLNSFLRYFNIGITLSSSSFTEMFFAPGLEL